ncbi:gastrin/cholecystokinin type B receptor-like isoform X2 [Bactrocera tryoni]|uniref:gastrin/cholecystokinin type B receptor-like isoform X2 n=1 Tax=Bactrocera tryoni TaxID=59916 RepID=UPI001A99282D|nr:gastrin/cholecystokinin type B receptor-like isoform X2 [Bactrocera tryoni]
MSSVALHQLQKNCKTKLQQQQQPKHTHRTALIMSITANQYSDLLAYFSNDSAANNILSLALTQLNDTHTLTVGNFSNFSNLAGESNMYATTNDSSDTSLLLLVTQSAMYANASANASDYGDNDGSAVTNRSAYVVTAAGRPRMPTEMPFWLILCYSIIFFCAIIGNLLVISTLIQNRRMRTITNLFLLNLAISDILLGVFCMPVTLVGTLLRDFIFGESFCKLIPFLQAISVAVSSWTLVAISCERYYAICHPLRSRAWQTLNHAYRIIGSIWVCSLICMTPIAIFSQLMPTSQGLRKCREQWPADSVAYERSYNIFLDLILLVLPLLILSFAYMLITRTLYVGMQNERAMIFGSVAPIVAGGSGAGGGLCGISVGGGGSGSGGKLCSELETLTTALVPNPAATLTTPATTAKKPTSRFQFNVSFRVRGRSACSGSVDDLGEQQQQQQQHNAMKKSKSQCRQLQQQSMQEQQKQYSEANQPCYDDIVSTPAIATTAVSHKRKLLTATDGRRHLYCMRSGSIKSLNHNNNDRNGGLGSSSKSTSTSSSMTVINVPQQQRFKLYQQRHQSQQQLHQHQQQQQQQLQMYIQQQDIERSKSTSTPSLRLHDTALRRSNKTKSLESKKRVIKMLFVLVLEFFICWTPLYIINTVAMFIGPVIYEYVGYRWIPFLQLLAYSSSCCNPITYCFMNAGFRRAFLDTFKGIQLSGVFFRRKNSSNNSVAGNSIIMANSGTIMTTNTVLDSPRL